MRKLTLTLSRLWRAVSALSSALRDQWPTLLSLKVQLILSIHPRLKIGALVGTMTPMFRTKESFQGIHHLIMTKLTFLVAISLYQKVCGIFRFAHNPPFDRSLGSNESSNLVNEYPLEDHGLAISSGGGKGDDIQRSFLQLLCSLVSISPVLIILDPTQ